MAKRSSNSNDNKLNEKQVKPEISIVDDTKKQVSVKVEPEMVLVRSCRPVKYIHELLSGKIIVFEGADSSHRVTRRDADILLAKKRTGCGCGSQPQTNSIFEEVK